MWATLAQIWVSISLALETLNSATRTINNLVTTAEEHSANFKQTSLIELATKKTQAERQAAATLAA